MDTHLLLLTLVLPAMGGISPYMSVTWPQPVGIRLITPSKEPFMFFYPDFIQILFKYLNITWQSPDVCSKDILTFFERKYSEGHYKLGIKDRFSLHSCFIKTSPKGFSASKCDVENWIFSKSWEVLGNLSGIFLGRIFRDFWGVSWIFSGILFSGNFCWKFFVKI